MADDVRINIQIIGRVLLEDFTKGLINDLVSMQAAIKTQEETMDAKEYLEFLETRKHPLFKSAELEALRRDRDGQIAFDTMYSSLPSIPEPFFGHRKSSRPPSQSDAYDALLAYSARFYIGRPPHENLTMWWNRVRERLHGRPGQQGHTNFVAMMDVVIAAVSNTALQTGGDACANCDAGNCKCPCLDCSVRRSKSPLQRTASPKSPIPTSPLSLPPLPVGYPYATPRPSVTGSTSTVPSPGPAAIAMQEKAREEELTPEQKKLGIRSARYLRGDSDID
jgi:hypothetical protein